MPSTTRTRMLAPPASAIPIVFLLACMHVCAYLHAHLPADVQRDDDSISLSSTINSSFSWGQKMCTAVFFKKYVHSQIRTRRRSLIVCLWLGSLTDRAASASLTNRASHHPHTPARLVDLPGRAPASARLQPTHRPVPRTSCGKGGARLPAARAAPLAARGAKRAQMASAPAGWCISHAALAAKPLQKVP